MSKEQGQLVNLENLEFERLFVVYGSDQVEARYILSTSFMERLVALHRLLDQLSGSRFKLVMSFKENAMHMAINWDKNLFEVNTDQPYSEQANRIRQEVQMLVDVVEALDLNTRIWSKAM